MVLGEGVEAAMDALRESDERELSALSKQVNASRSAPTRQAGAGAPPLADQEKGLHALATSLPARGGRPQVHQREHAQALPVLHTALLCAEVGSGSNHKAVVAPAALADLHISEGGGGHRTSQRVHRRQGGPRPDAPEVGQHLIGLGTAYHQQGKLEAAALTLEEARSILVYALGEKDEQVTLFKEKIKKLSVIEFDFNVGTTSSSTPSNFASRMEARLAQRDVKQDQLNLEAISKKQIAADLRRHGLLSARGTKAGEHFNYASHVAERVATEQEKRAAGERRELLTKKEIFRERLRKRTGVGARETTRTTNRGGEARDVRGARSR